MAELLSLWQQRDRGRNTLNRIIYLIILTITGLIISFLTRNIIVSILACSVLGLLLNREIFSFGKQDYSDPSIHPSEFHQKFQIYKDHVAIHEYSFTDYEDTVLDSIFIDAIGQFWSLGLESLDWYHLVDEKWIREEPKHRMILTSWYEEMEGELI